LLEKVKTEYGQLQQKYHNATSKLEKQSVWKKEVDHLNELVKSKDKTLKELREAILTISDAEKQILEEAKLESNDALLVKNMQKVIGMVHIVMQVGCFTNSAIEDAKIGRKSAEEEAEQVRREYEAFKRKIAEASREHPPSETTSGTLTIVISALAPSLQFNL